MQTFKARAALTEEKIKGVENRRWNNLRALLAEHGLFIVGEADMAVLRGMDMVPDGSLDAIVDGERNYVPPSVVSALMDEQVRRRAAQKGTGT